MFGPKGALAILLSNKFRMQKRSYWKGWSRVGNAQKKKAGVVNH